MRRVTRQAVSARPYTTDAHVIKIISEVRAMFPGRLLHVGGRDVSAACLAESPGGLTLPSVLSRSATAKAAAWSPPHRNTASFAEALKESRPVGRSAPHRRLQSEPSGARRRLRALEGTGHHPHDSRRSKHAAHSGGGGVGRGGGEHSGGSLSEQEVAWWGGGKGKARGRSDVHDSGKLGDSPLPRGTLVNVTGAEPLEGTSPEDCSAAPDAGGPKDREAHILCLHRDARNSERALAGGSLYNHSTDVESPPPPCICMSILAEVTSIGHAPMSDRMDDFNRMLVFNDPPAWRCPRVCLGKTARR